MRAELYPGLNPLPFLSIHDLPTRTSYNQECPWGQLVGKGWAEWEDPGQETIGSNSVMCAGHHHPPLHNRDRNIQPACILDHWSIQCDVVEILKGPAFL